MSSETLSNFSYTEIKNYRNFIKTKSKDFNLSCDTFLDEGHLLDIWYAERQNHVDVFGREQSISSIRSNDIKKKLMNKLEQHLTFQQDYHIDVHLCKLVQPTHTHIDGHLPFLDNKKYCIAKIFIIPLAFDTDCNDTSSLNTYLVKFKQHYNYYTEGGYEYTRLLLQNNLTYNSYNLEDEKLNIMDKHNEKFFYDEDPTIFNHFQSHFSKLQVGLDIEKVSKMKLGSIESLNPYQIHCSGDFKSFTCKWVCRIVLYLKF
jgi:hypothetical protein